MSKIIPVYFVKKEKLLRPGVVISSEPIEIATSLKLHEDKLQADTRTCVKGLPHDITVDEANLRMFIDVGFPSLKELYKAGSYKKQKEVLEEVIKSQNLPEQFKWCRWNFWGPDPVMIVSQDKDSTLLLLSLSLKGRTGCGTVLQVPTEDIREVSSEQVFKYYFCRDMLIIPYIQKNPASLAEDIDKFASEVFDTILSSELQN